MDKVEIRARELLATEYENGGAKRAADEVRTVAIADMDGWHRMAIRAITAALREQPGARGVVLNVKQVGNYGAAYDLPGTCRAFTYDHQPGNVDASRLGAAAVTAANASAGDSIDRGLALLKALREIGFGVFQITAAQQPAPPSAPVGVELDAAALGRFAQDEWMDCHAAYPAWGFLTDAEQAAWIAVGERIKRVVSLTQQPAQAAPGDASFQSRVSPWMLDCFGAEIADDQRERGDRLLEETLELLQSHGYDPARVATLTEYVYGRPVGEPVQEVGGVMVTLAAYCRAARIDMHEAGERELARILQPEIMEKIRRKQASKRGLHTPLPTPPGDGAAGGGRGR